MKKIMISILIVGMLLSTTLVNVSGEKASEKNTNPVINATQKFSDDSNYTINQMLDNEIIRSKYLERKQNPLDNDSLKLPRYAPGEIIVRFQEDTKIDFQTTKGSMLTGIRSIDNLNTKYGGLKSVNKVFKNDPASSLSNVYTFSFSSSTDISGIVREYSSESDVVYAEPNYLYTTSYAQPKIVPNLPNDLLFGQQWALNQSNDCDVDAPEAWAIETGDTDVVIAIVDTGVDYNHPDLATNIWHDPIYGNPGYDFVDINTTEYVAYGYQLCPDEDYTVPDADPMDVFCHGTHCAGIASAVTNNSIGIAGISWNCKIMPVRVGFKLLVQDFFGNWFEVGVLEYDDMVNGIVYAADKGVDVISMSYGGFFSSNLEKDVLGYASSKGVVLVAAAGNDDTYLESYPAAYNNVVAVAATDSNDHRADFSNYGSWVDVAAPGVDILSTIPNGAYDSFSGTSMACPYVAGLAGLILSKNQNCPYPAEMVNSMIPYSTDEIDADQYIGTGRINAYKALINKPFAALLYSIPNWEDVKGTIDLTGVALGENFQYYTMEDGLGENPGSWSILKNSSVQQGGVLLPLDTTDLQEGLHTVRLKVVCSHGVYTDEIQVYINNEADGTYDADVYVSNCYDSSTPGWGDSKFASIQEGIDNARYGDTVFVYDGIYNENVNCTIKSLELIGQSNNWTIVNGAVIIKLARHVTVKGFNIRGYENFTDYPFPMPTSVILEASKYCTITQNKIKMPEIMTLYYGILLCLSSCNTISDNTIDGLPVIYDWFEVLTFGIIGGGSSHNTISNNIFRNFQKHMFIAGSTDNDIQSNHLKFGQFGVLMVFGIRHTINNNHITAGDGIWLVSVSLSKITKNVLGNNSLTLQIEGSHSFNKIVANEIFVEDVGMIGIWMTKGGGYNEIYYNNFIHCFAQDQSGIASKNKWYKEKLFGDDKGNYWSEYVSWLREYEGKEAKDDNNDGIWDDPIRIANFTFSRPCTEDKYPVVEPFDIQNMDLSAEMTIELTSEQSQYITQLEDMIDNKMLSGESNIESIIDFYLYIFSEMNNQSEQSNTRTRTQPSVQPNIANQVLSLASEPITQTTIGSTTLFSKTLSR